MNAHRSSFALAGLLAVAATAAPSVAAGNSEAAPLCAPSALALSIENADGTYSGMSHSGLDVVLANVSNGACAIPRRPILGFEDARGRTVPIDSAPPVPRGVSRIVLVPLVLEPGARAVSTLRWVSSDAYGANHCAEASQLAVALSPDPAASRLRAPVTVTACGPAAPSRISFGATLWQISVPSPSPSRSPGLSVTP